MSHIFVVEDYFPQETYKLVCENILQVEFIPPPPERRELVEEDSGSSGGTYWFQKRISSRSDVAKKCFEQIKPKFFHDPKKIQTILYTIVSPQKQFAPHVDNMGKYQVLIYLIGDETVNNGTGFYKPDKEGNLNLNTHIGFRENRAILFTKDNYHANLLWAGNSSMRYSIGFDFE